ncbi:GGDEF domain-containing protein [Marispirochaeta aestuarii]|uniref:GGDEF domain-containing protein n=1 Tax=Marispirochaeta aestuarii TaxID=1963862 RepID=UPI0029C84C5B|nr:GGDEF domain-containing protein [Marispirochaeta aestuarii]
MIITKYLPQMFPQVTADFKSDFDGYRFQRNNQRIFIISVFLVFEQLFYGIFVSGRGSNLHAVYYISAFAMLLMSLVCGFFILHKPENIRIHHKIHELSLGILGMGVALIRLLFFEFDMLRIPTIYIAVLYGVAVLFYISYGYGLFLYAFLSLSIILLTPLYHPGTLTSRYIADISSNGIIAWIVSAMNYRNFVSIFLNRKEIEKKNEELRERSIRDELTGLYNRRKINSVLKEVHARAERYASDFTVIILDIDHFKHINDTFGHHLGDIVLRQISAILSGNIREVDTCGRWGGEEFLIICPEADVPHAEGIAGRLRLLIGEYKFQHNKKVTASFGIASFREFPDLDSLLKIADMRLYQAKLNGRNRVDAVTVFSLV